MQRLPRGALAALALLAAPRGAARAGQAQAAPPAPPAPPASVPAAASSDTGWAAEPCFESPAAPETSAAQPAKSASDPLSDAELAKLAEQQARTEVIPITGGSPPRRGAVLDYLVAPSGGELTAAFRLITTDDAALGGPPLRLSDLALAELSGRWAALPRLELSGQIALLAKQPARTSEKPWQSAGLTARTPLGDHGAIAIGGAGGHLIAHPGMWLTGSSSAQWRAPIASYVHFDLVAGLDATRISASGAMPASDAPRAAASGATSASFADANASFQTLFTAVDSWAFWVGVAYAIPLGSRGADPTTGLAIDPRARLDVHAGTTMVVAVGWDVFAEYAVIDRGDASAPATRLPILDGGFDQRQLLLGVTHHFEGAGPARRHGDHNE